jgi:hypothetical protein
LKHLFGCHFKHLWKKRNIIVTFQSGQLTEQPIAKYYFYHGFGLKVFEERHIRIMHNVQDYSVFYNIALRPTVCEGSSNLKTYLPSALKHLFGCHFKHLWKKRNIIVTFQSGQLTEQPKTLDDLGYSIQH